MRREVLAEQRQGEGGRRAVCRYLEAEVAGAAPSAPDRTVLLRASFLI
jgi:hypothetical protein